MTFALPPLTNDEHDEQGVPTAPSRSTVRALSPDLVERFHILIEEVTSDLMQGQPGAERRACRFDAIALLIASCKQLDSTPEQGKSPLMYLLMEEQQKAAALREAPADLTYWKA